MAKILVIYGTRPEVIKIAPIAWAMSESIPNGNVELVFVNTGQHPDLVPPMEQLLGIRPNFTLERRTSGGSALDQLLSGVLNQVGEILSQHSDVEAVVVQGDTSTALAGAIAGFHAGVQIVHVEAGLRTPSAFEPFPEEMNRRLISRLATWHCAPTKRAVNNLLAEGVNPNAVLLTGNTVVDATKSIASGFSDDVAPFDLLITMHRRENWGEPMSRALTVIRDFCVALNLTARFVLHANPVLQHAAHLAFDDTPNVQILPPQDYLSMLKLIKACRFMASDSGGIQEEAVTLQKPVVVLRTDTERPEAIESGWARLAGHDFIDLEQGLQWAIAHPGSLARQENPFGDGLAGARIAQLLANLPDR